MKSRSGFFPLALALAFASISHAQEPATVTAPEPPEAVVKAFAASMQTDGMKNISRFLHPDELARFKGMLMPVFSKDGAMKGEGIKAFFGPDATVTSIEALTPAQFMDAFMATVGEQLKSVAFGDVELLGSVKEKDVVHLVARVNVTTGPIQARKMEVISVRPYQNGWRMMLSGDFEGIAAALSARP